MNARRLASLSSLHKASLQTLRTKIAVYDTDYRRLGEIRLCRYPACCGFVAGLLVLGRVSAPPSQPYYLRCVRTATCHCASIAPLYPNIPRLYRNRFYYYYIPARWFFRSLLRVRCPVQFTPYPNISILRTRELTHTPFPHYFHP